MSFDDAKFSDMIKNEPDALSALFAGDIVSESTDDDGVFTKLNAALRDIVTSHNSTLKILSRSYDEKMDNLEESKSKAQARLDDRYKILAKKFASFDALIGRINNQFSSLNMIIQSELNQKK